MYQNKSVNLSLFTNNWTSQYIRHYLSNPTIVILFRRMFAYISNRNQDTQNHHSLCLEISLSRRCRSHDFIIRMDLFPRRRYAWSILFPLTLLRYSLFIFVLLYNTRCKSHCNSWPHLVSYLHYYPLLLYPWAFCYSLGIFNKLLVKQVLVCFQIGSSHIYNEESN